MITIKRTDSTDRDLTGLVLLLDKELQDYDGEEHAFYHQFNSVVKLKQVLIAYNEETPVACGAIKEYDKDSAEVKRMFVLKDFRGKGISKLILTELERWAKELGFNSTILETGKKQISALNLYEKAGYTVIPNYDQYIGVDNSICMKKSLDTP